MRKSLYDTTPSPLSSWHGLAPSSQLATYVLSLLNTSWMVTESCNTGNITAAEDDLAQIYTISTSLAFKAT